jgi:molecular chaperone GrpE
MDKNIDSKDVDLKESKSDSKSKEGIGTNESKIEIDSKDDSKLKIQELTDSLKRLQAEFENYQKRTDKQNCEVREFASAKLIDDLLPVVDSLEQGIKHNKEFVLVYEQLLSILKKNGLEKINVNVGDKFDHETMECLMQESKPELKDGVVSQVLSTGYFLKGKILRHTKIGINQKN